MNLPLLANCCWALPASGVNIRASTITPYGARTEWEQEGRPRTTMSGPLQFTISDHTKYLLLKKKEKKERKGNHIP